VSAQRRQSGPASAGGSRGQGEPRFLAMAGLVALVVAVVILVFFALGYLLGRLFL
jgi:hypothetical protein